MMSSSNELCPIASVLTVNYCLLLNINMKQHPPEAK